MSDDATLPPERKLKETFTTWEAHWVGPDSDPRSDLGIFLFRTELALKSVPETCPIRISADQRYNLYVNGQFVDFGPQRGDPAHWFYETIDLAPYLRKGLNWVVAQVWNYGRVAAMAQHTVRTALVVESLVIPELNTPGRWEVARAPGWDFAFLQDTLRYVYIDVGPGDVVDGQFWQPALLAGAPGDLTWTPTHDISRAEERGTLSGSVPWSLIPRSIPPMRHHRRRTALKARTGPAAMPWTVTQGQPLVLDAGELLCAYPNWTVRAPVGTVVEFIYAEAAVDEHRQKGNRNDVDGKQIIGYADRVTVGSEALNYTPLWWRTFRYIQVQLTAGTEATIELSVDQTGYPLEVTSTYASSDPDTPALWEVSVRTAELCAGETYFDCPYYEQLQYVGDTRIQAQITRYLGRDRDLPRNAVRTLAWSQLPEGLTQSRYPSRQMQIIPPFSLWWILMLHDQAFYDTVEISAEDRQRAARIIESWDRLIEGDPDATFWCFGDWVPAWNWGVPPGGARSTMHRLTLLLARIAYAQLAKRSLDAGRENFLRELRTHYTREAGLVRSTADSNWAPSEHAEALYRVAQRMLDESPDPWPITELDAANAARCTYYFQYYLHQARPDADYGQLLAAWRKQLALGLTTFAENPEPTRSDCHAWSAHPILGFFQHVAGITSRATGWSRVRIAPVPGALTSFDACLAHPAGDLRVALREGKLEITTPVPAEVIWAGKTCEIAPGTVRF